MNPIAQSTPLIERRATRVRRRSIQALLTPLHQLAETSDHLLAGSCGSFRCGADDFSLPRFIFDGPRGGGEPIRLGIFAGIHGDEPEGAIALVRFLTELAGSPALAAGYRIYAYPVCNPTGYEDDSREARGGKDLNREFWKSSLEPEVCLLEGELWKHAFHGIINLHCDDTSDGLYGFVHGPDLSKDLLLPALWAAEQHLSRNQRVVIDGFPARQGLIDGGYPGILAAPADAQPMPFQLTFETPQEAPVHLQVEAHIAALKCILAEYRAVIALGQNI